MSYPPTPTPMPGSTRRGGGCVGIALKGCLVVLALVVCAIALGVVAFQTGNLTMGQLLALVGMGPATIQLTNFRDDPLAVTVTRLQVADDGTSFETNHELDAFDILTTQISNPGQVRVEFRDAKGSATLGACTLTARGGDQFQFVALPERILITRENHPPASGRDLILASSSLCR